MNVRRSETRDGTPPAPAACNDQDRATQTNGERPTPDSDVPALTTLLRIASEISGQVSAILDPDELLNTVIPLLKEGFGVYYAHVYTLDAERGTLRLRAGYGAPGQEMLERGHKIPLDAEKSLVARAARTRTPVVVNDVASEEDWLPNPLLPETKSELALPMVVGDEVLGVFDVQDDVQDAFSQAYCDVLFTLAGQIATALQNARFVERIEQSLAETRVRLEIREALVEAQTEEAVLSALAAQADAGDGATTVIALLDPEAIDPTLEIRRVAGREIPEAGLSVGRRIRAEAFPFFQLVADRPAFVARDLAAVDELPEGLPTALDAVGVRSLAIYALATHRERFGVLVVLAQARDAFDRPARFRYETLAEQGAIALQQAQLQDRLSLTQFSVDHAPAAIFWIHPDGTLHTANQTACDLLGYTSAELCALPGISDLDPNMIPNVWGIHWEKVKAQKRFTIETEYRTQKGRLIPVEVMANYLKYGDEEYNCIFARDISERKQAEAARERFTVQLRTAAEIAEQVGAILDLDQLLDAIIPLLKERFELYHAHLYLLEDEELVLRSGYGRIGQIMVQQGHKIALGHPHSLVARAARTREPVLVNDVSEAPDFLPNLLLPHTQSEVAVPIIMADRVLGVFDVQSDKVDNFTASDLDVFRTLSGQLANAIYSASLFEQQRATQQELRKSVQTVRAIFNAMTEGILVTDMMGRILDLNEATLRLYGYEARSDLVGRSAMDLVTQSGWSRMAENTRRALAADEGTTLELPMVRRDGSAFDAEQSSALLWGDDDEPQGVVSITRDITAQKRAQQEIARFKALAENAVDAIFMADLSAAIIYANPAAHRLFGYDLSEQEMVGASQKAGGAQNGKLTLPDLWPPSEVELLLTETLPAAGEAGWQGEAQQVRKDGSIFDAALTVFAVRGERNEPISVAAIVRDITDRKAAEAELRRFAMQLRTAADVSAQVSAILDPTALLESVVPLVQERFAVYHLHVYTLDSDGGELVMRVGSGEAGRLMRERGHTIALDRRPSLVAKAARSREIVLVDDVTQDAGFLPNPLLPETRSEVAIPMVVGDEVVGVLDVQDSTPGRFTESDVDVFSTLAAQIAIAFRNAQYFEEIQAAAERLREVDRLKSEFLANMSHELRTPLNSILGYAEVMLMGIDGELTPEMEEDVNVIFENGKQLLRLINDILDLTKIEAGRMTLDKEPVDLPALLEQTRSHSLGLLHQQPKPVEVHVSADETLPQVIADPVRLAQVLNNLVSNAIKFTDEGEVRLRARHLKDQGCVAIEVADTGVGIAEEDLAHLFERFRQVDGSSTRRAEGTGLGLAISKHLVEMHGGTLTAESELGRGSTFTVRIPIDG
ncbi:MAG: GAF domain-containing protein [Anaerolineae bacterium]